MFDYTDMMLSVMQRIEIYNEIFNSVSKEIQEFQLGMNRRGKDTYLFCKNNVVRFMVEEEQFRKNLHKYKEKQATEILLKGLATYKEGIYYWLTALNESCEILDEIKYEHSLTIQASSFKLINQACKEACGGIESAHSVHKM